MKNKKIYAFFTGIFMAIISLIFISADHVDSPSVANTTSDIASFYAFEGNNPDNTVFIATLQGPLIAGEVTEEAIFDEDVMVEFNIDNTGDFVEDIVIQLIRRDSIMYIFGPSPVTAEQSGVASEIFTENLSGQVEVSTTSDTFIETTTNGMTIFAGPRRDPFFSDFNQLQQVVTGNAAPEGFLPEGQASDFFENLNVLAIVVEVPNALLGVAPTHIGTTFGIANLPNAYNVWVTTKRKQ